MTSVTDAALCRPDVIANPLYFLGAGAVISSSAPSGQGELMLW
jgi:hypothetical protein